jgi:hypothetical protein
VVGHSGAETEHTRQRHAGQVGLPGPRAGPRNAALGLDWLDVGQLGGPYKRCSTLQSLTHAETLDVDLSFAVRLSVEIP